MEISNEEVGISCNHDMIFDYENETAICKLCGYESDIYQIEDE